MIAVPTQLDQQTCASMLMLLAKTLRLAAEVTAQQMGKHTSWAEQRQRQCQGRRQNKMLRAGPHKACCHGAAVEPRTQGQVIGCFGGGATYHFPFLFAALHPPQPGAGTAGNVSTRCQKWACGLFCRLLPQRLQRNMCRQGGTGQLGSAAQAPARMGALRVAAAPPAAPPSSERRTARTSARVACRGLGRERPSSSEGLVGVHHSSAGLISFLHHTTH